MKKLSHEEIVSFCKLSNNSKETIKRIEDFVNNIYDNKNKIVLFSSLFYFYYHKYYLQMCMRK